MKVAREKHLVMYKGAPTTPPMDFSAETLKNRRWHGTYKALKEKCQPRIPYLAELYFNN